MALVTALLVKNEADRYLTRVLQHCQTFSDQVLVLDDRSTDDTPKIAKDLGCQVKRRSVVNNPMWGNESPARAELWDWGSEVVKDGWLLIADADMVLQGNPKPYTMAWGVNGWSFVLYDLWDSETTYRADGYWQGHRTPRPWLFKPSAVPPSWTPQWSGRGLHAGHCPVNFPLLTGFAEDLSWLHYSFMRPDDRVRKHRSYLERADLLSPFERAHAESILEA